MGTRSGARRGCRPYLRPAILRRAGHLDTPAGLAEAANLFTNHLLVVNNLKVGIDFATPFLMKRDISNERRPGKQGYRRHPRYRALTGLQAERGTAIDELYEWLERHGHRSFPSIKSGSLDL